MRICYLFVAIQVKVYKDDFEAERKSREELNDKRLELVEHNNVLTERVKQLEEELATTVSEKQLSEMQRRHSYYSHVGGGANGATPEVPVQVRREAVQTRPPVADVRRHPLAAINDRVPVPPQMRTLHPRPQPPSPERQLAEVTFLHFYISSHVSDSISFSMEFGY